MNPCVKTGIVFVDDATGQKHTGDLFFGFQLRGIPLLQDGRPAPRIGRADIIIAGAEYQARAGGRYAETETGLRIISSGADFDAHLREWYPELINVLTWK